ncbi:protein translocase subunit SecF [Demequina muriae]|uniref:Protein-export membrane protein SecF n=1 Tax=Demequina muriae TaxID=3051664 RepID=A0ABT8GJQ9_9MICO|nr:protein translocase subunit SecF [Demequina sp. EGI L300058]MDN4481655.1 protein translocase subunit SecF [Demequina sp. EGI L300058]
MSANLATWGNKLHSGEKTYPIVQHRGRFFIASAILMLAALGLLVGKGLNPGIDFTGGTQYVLANVSDTDSGPAEEAIAAIDPAQEPRISVLGENDLRVQLGVLEDADQQALGDALSEAYGVPLEDISFDQIGPTWGAEVGAKALQALVIFLLLVFTVITLYFRAWRMAAAAIIALLHDLLFTVGIYALVGFEVTPASVIGFLTILGYSLYDTVVVFDKVKENTQDLTAQSRYTYAELANLAVNQTLVRSINTSIVALLPVGSILFIGSFLLGAGTLSDIALALFVGMAVGTYSSVFVATPLEVALRRRESRIQEHTAKVLALRESGEADVVVHEDGTVRVGALQPGEHRGTKAQPRRKGRH